MSGIGGLFIEVLKGHLSESDIREISTFDSIEEFENYLKKHKAK